MEPMTELKKGALKATIGKLNQLNCKAIDDKIITNYGKAQDIESEDRLNSGKASINKMEKIYQVIVESRTKTTTPRPSLN